MNIYKEVTDRIIAELEKGIIPWNKPWVGAYNGAFNRVSKKPYSFLNQILLGQPGEYASFKQWKKLGGTIRKGEKSQMVVFWKIIKKEEENDDGEMETKTFPILRYYNVFHISQVDGVNPLPDKELKDVEPISAAENIIADYVKREKITFAPTKGDKACYIPAKDTVIVPLIGQFDDVNEYYSTAFHELTHSTGHSSRLDRFSNDSKEAAFGSQTYSKEELVAEIGAAAIMNSISLETEGTFKNSAAYIQNWLKVLKNDNRFIVSAAGKAEKAVKLILNEDNKAKTA